MHEKIFQIHVDVTLESLRSFSVLSRDCHPGDFLYLSLGRKMSHCLGLFYSFLMLSTWWNIASIICINPNTIIPSEYSIINSRKYNQRYSCFGLGWPMEVWRTGISKDTRKFWGDNRCVSNWLSRGIVRW
jgi:hypothetical protein